MPHKWGLRYNSKRSQSFNMQCTFRNTGSEGGRASGRGGGQTSVQDLRATRPSRFFFLKASAMENTLPPVPRRSLVCSMHVETRGMDAMTCSSTGSSSLSTQWMHRTGQLSAHNLERCEGTPHGFIYATENVRLTCMSGRT